MALSVYKDSGTRMQELRTQAMRALLLLHEGGEPRSLCARIRRSRVALALAVNLTVSASVA